MAKFLWLAGMFTACAGLAVGSVATAAPPVTTPVPFQETFPGFTGACDFPITVTFNTQQTMRDWKSADGTVLRMFVTGKGTVNLVNEENERAQGFYAKSGFGKIGRKRFLVGERWEEDFVMERVF